MSHIVGSLYFLYDLFIPRFITEDIIIDYIDEEITVRGSLLDVMEGEEFNYIGTVRAFIWLDIVIYWHITNIREVYNA